MKNWIATLLIVTGLLGVSALADARPGFSGDRPMDPLEHIERMAEHLDLSAEQEQRITDIVNAAQISNAVDRERLQQIRDELRNLTESFDAGIAQGLADELGQIAGRLAYSHASTMAEVRAVFTPEQLQQLEELRARRDAYRGESGYHRREKFGG